MRNLAMNDSLSQQNQIEVLAEEFLERRRRGERPTVAEYAAQYPELADEIRACFPALLLVEDLKPGSADPTTGPEVLPPGAGRGLLPERLGDYRILREVGRGGMGVVYEAEQESLGRHVALKVLPSQFSANPTYLQRFRREARSAARLHHTNIVPVFDVGEFQGIHYYAMQFILGQGLDEVLDELRRLRGETTQKGIDPPGNDGAIDPKLTVNLARGLLTDQFAAGEPGSTMQGAEDGPASRAPESETKTAHTVKMHVAGSELSTQSEYHFYRSVARVGLQVAEAVAYAHAQKVLHRDIKPANLLLDLQGTVWVTDFGLAKEEGDDLTQTGDIVGTLRYMAPERFNGLSDARSDVYSLGLTLYELLTLRTAFAETDRGRLIQRIAQEEPAAPRKLDRHVPRDLETIVLKAIAKEPRLRYQTAAELAEDLARYLADRPIRARRSAAWEHVWRWCRRNPAVAGLSVGLALMAVIVTVVSVVAALRLGDAAEQAGRAERDAQEQLCDSLYVQAHAGRTSRQPGQRLDSLMALERAAQLGRALGRGPADFAKWRDEAVACLALPDVRLEQEWEGNPPGTTGLGFDARFEHYARSFQDEGLCICRVVNHQELLRLPTLPAERVSRWLIPRFSPDGRFLAVWYALWTSKRPLEVWELKPGVSRPMITLADAATQPEFSPDGESLAVGLSDSSLCLFNLAAGQQTRRETLDLVPERLAFHPDSQKIAVSSTKQHQVQVRDLKSGRILYTLAHPAGVQAVAWHPEGRLLASGCDDRRIYLWDGATGARRGVLEGHSWEVHDLAFSQNGDWLASFGWDMTLRLWDVATAKPLWHLENVRVVGFRREEPLQAAAISGRQVQLWGCVRSNEFHMLRGLTSNIIGTALSPDGRHLACSTSSGVGCLWDVHGRHEVEGSADAQNLAWDPEGNLWSVSNKGHLRRRPVRSLRHGEGGRVEAGATERLLPEPVEPGAAHVLTWIDWDRQLLLIHSPAPIDRLQMFAMGGTARRLWKREVPNLMTTGLDAKGRWLAFGTQDGGHGISIFEARTGKLVKELEIGDAQPGLSPDGRWLVTSTGRLTTPEGECSLWRTDTWEKVRARPLRRSSSSPAALTVSPDGALLAVAYTMSEVQLLRLETLEAVVTLTAPELGLIATMEFSRDGRRLFVAVGNTVHVWDLRALRRGLRGIGLDWDGSAGDAKPPQGALRDPGLWNPTASR
jgi:serine/threonine protein kinase/WD40 repeat protein